MGVEVGVGVSDGAATVFVTVGDAGAVVTVTVGVALGAAAGAEDAL